MPVNPAATGLVEGLNSALTAMFEDGTYAEIYERWFDNDLERVDRP